jgi:monoterpene epsilon-lactone hydrolase
MLIASWTDLEAAGGSLDYNAGNDAISTREWIAATAAGFLDGHDPRDPAAGPLHADLGGFGPRYIQVGEQELLPDDSRLLAAHAQQAEVEAGHRRADGRGRAPCRACG